MSRTVFSSLAVALLLSTLATFTHAQSTDSTKADELVEAKEWFDGLGHDLLRPFVKVATGGWSKSGGKEYKDYDHGFLQSVDGNVFRILLPDLESHTARVSGPEVEELERIDYEGANLKAFAEAACEYDATDDESVWEPFQDGISSTASLFTVARACELTGHRDVANRLYEIVRERARAEDVSVLEHIKETYGYQRIFALIREAGYPAISRIELEAGFEFFLEHFSGTEFYATAKEIHGQLKIMVTEDTAHQEPEWEELDDEGKIAELIYRLRDQNGQQWSWPGECDVFRVRGGEANPAERLFEFGLTAVPQLIEIVDDRRLTRSIGFWRPWVYSHHILRYGDCAIAILSRIAGRAFYKRTSTSGYPLRDGEGSAIKKEIEAWWEDVQNRGIEAVLIEGIERGDSNSPSQAEELAKRDPEATLAAIRKGMKSADRGYVRSKLVRVAGTLDQELAGEFVREQMLNGEDLYTRIVAARALRRWSDPEALPAMIREWRNRAWRQAEVSWRGEDDANHLARFLIHSGNSDAIEALQDGLEDISARIREDIIDECSDITSGALEDEEFRAAVEELLVGRLGDDDTLNMSGSRYDWHFSYPSVAECALFTLNHLWPDKYAFDPKAARRERAVELIRAQNVWRKQHGLPLLEVPRTPEIEPADKAVLDTLWAKIGTDDRSGAIEELEKLGLGALAYVSAKLEGKDPQDANWQPVFDLQRRLSRVVREVQLDAGGVKEAKEIKDALQGLQGRTLDLAVLESLLKDCVAKLPAGASEFTLEAWRDSDDTGVCISLKLVARQQPRTGWSYSMSVELDGDGLLNLGGVGTDGSLREEDSFDDIREPFHMIEESAHDAPFELRVEVESD